MGSLWSETVSIPRFSALNGDRRTDVLIIGGGMAGILCAYQLRQAGVDCILVEADRIGCGITKNTTAKITAQHGLIYHKILRQYGAEFAKLYYQANTAALDAFAEIAERIDCGFQRRDNVIYSLHNARKLEKELSALSRLGIPAAFRQELPLPMSTAGGVVFPDQAQFHPMKFLSAISAELPIFERTRVLELGKHTAITNRGRIRAEKIIIATHFPMLNKHGSYFLKLYQHRSYVIALADAPQLDAMYADESKTGLSFRNAEQLLLLGGGSHRTGKSGGNWQELDAFQKQHYPGSAMRYHWATQDCMSLDSIPYIGQYSLLTPNLYVATGFNKWGMTGSMTAALLLKDLVIGKDNPYERLFSPSRSMLHGQLLLNAAESTWNLLTPTAPRCPHLGCALKWNSAEHSWDCPCHGSRFEADGTLIDNPATGDMKRRK